jgi:hypothetical protein
MEVLGACIDLYLAVEKWEIAAAVCQADECVSSAWRDCYITSAV